MSKRSHNLLARSQACFLPQFLSHPVPARFGVPVRDGLVRGNFPKNGSESGEGRRGCLEGRLFLVLAPNPLGLGVQGSVG